VASLAVVGLVEHPEAALELAASCQPDVVVVDLALSGDHGLHLVPELLRRAPQARLVVLSAFVTPAVERAMEARGADACIDSRTPGNKVAAVVAELKRLETPRPPMSLSEVIASTSWTPAVLTTTLRPAAVQDPVQVVPEYLESALAGRTEEAIQQIIDLRRAGAELEQIVDGLLAAAIGELATRSEAGEVSLADLRLATAITSCALDALSTLSTTGPPLGMVTHVHVAGDDDVLRGRLLAEMLRQRGWQTVPLGATPHSELAEFLRRRRVNAVLASCSSAVYLDGVARLVPAVHGAGLRVLASGAAFGPNGRRAAQLGVDAWAADAKSAARVLGQWRVERYDARMAPMRVPVLGARADDVGMRAAAFARAASASFDEHLSALVEKAVRGAIAALLVDDDAVVSEVAATLRSAVRASSLPISGLLDALVEARDYVAAWDEHGLAGAQVDAVRERVADP
jgi:DNA-binding NarL/FixJ family response regulator